MQPLYQLAYVSAKAGGLTLMDEQHLLGISARNNRRTMMTGLIVSSAAHFLQILEGPEAALSVLLEKLKSDPRHHDMRTLFQRQVQKRSYANWSMGYIFSLDVSEELAALHYGQLYLEADEILIRFRPDEEGLSAIGRSVGSMRSSSNRSE